MKIWVLNRETGTISSVSVKSQRYNFALTRQNKNEIPEWISDDPRVEDFDVWHDSIPHGGGLITKKDLEFIDDNMFYIYAGSDIRRDHDDTTRDQTKTSVDIEKSYSDRILRRNEKVSRSFCQLGRGWKSQRVLASEYLGESSERNESDAVQGSGV